MRERGKYKRDIREKRTRKRKRERERERKVKRE